MKTIQVTLDSRDAVQSALWWAETLEWEFEWLERELFEQIKAGGFCTDADVVEIDGRLSWRDGAAINSGGPRDTQQRMYFQTVPEPKVGKNRMHIDVRTGDTGVPATVAALLARGATKLGEGTQGPHSWVVMGDPEGNEFCVS